MAAGSVRLPELRQDIKVDTKDLDRAIAAARRFKSEMDRSLNSGGSSGADRSFAALEKRLGSMRAETERLRSEITGLGSDLRDASGHADRHAASLDKGAIAAQKLATSNRDARAALADLGGGLRDAGRDADEASTALTRLESAASAARRGLSGGFNIDISRWKTQMGEARETLQGLRDDTQDAAAAAELLGSGMRGMRGDVDDARGSLAGLAAEARKFSTAISRAFTIDTSRWRSQVGEVRELLRGLADDSERVVGSQERLGAAFRLSRESSDEHTAALRALADAADNVSGGVNRLEEQVRLLGDSGRSSSNTLKSIERDTSNLARGTSLAARGVKALGDGIKTLGLAGVVAGGIGVLGGSVIGLSAAAAGAVPAALGLTGALGGLGVSVLGLKAIFSDNKGIEPAVESLKKAFGGISDDLQARVNPSINGFLKQVEGLAPLVRRQVPAFANAFRELTDGATQMLRDAGFQRDLEAILKSGIEQFRLFGQAGLIAFRGIIGLAAETGPFVERLGRLARDAATDFAAWVAEARRTGEITALLNHATDVLVALGRTVRDLAVGFKNLFNASNVSGFTDAVLGALTGIAADFRRFTAERQADLQAMFRNLSTQVGALRPLIGQVADSIRVLLTNIDLRPLVEGVIAILPNLAGGLAEAANAAARLGREAAPAVNSLISLVRELISDAERIGTAFLRNVVPAIDAVRPGVERLGEALAKISESVLPVLGGALTNLGRIASTLIGFLAPVAEFVGSAIGLLGNMQGALGQVLTAVIALKVGQAIFGNLGRALVGTIEPTTRLQRAMAAIGDGARTGATAVGVAAIDMANAYGTATTRVQGHAERIGASASSASIRTIEAFRNMVTNGTLTAAAGFARLAEQGVVTGNRLAEGIGNGGVRASAALNNAVGTMATALGPRLGGAVTAAVSGFGRLGGAAAGIASGGFTAARTAISGLTGALGGPWGVAITGAVAVLGLLSQRSAEAAQKQKDLQVAFEQSGGAIDANVKSIVQSDLEQRNLAAGAEALGVTQTELASAFAEGGAKAQEYVTRLDELAGGARSNALGMTELGANLGSTSDKYAELSNAAKDWIQKITEQRARQREVAEALTATNNAMTTQQRHAQDISQGFDKVRQSAGDASKAVDGMKQALDGLTGRTASLDEANRNLGQAIRDMASSATEGSGKISILNGDLDEGTEAGGRFYDSATRLRDAMLESSKAAFDAAGGTSNLAEATARVTDVVNRSRQAVIDNAVAQGASKEEAEKYADSLGLIPEKVLTTILADPAKAQETIEKYKSELINAKPIEMKIGGDPRPLEATARGAGQDIENADPAKAPIGGETAPLDKDAEAGRQKVEGTPATMPIHAGLRGPGLAETEMEAFVARINAYPAAVLPVKAGIQGSGLVETELQALVARINAFPDARLPVRANFEAFNTELANRLADIARAPVPVPLSANIDRLNQQYAEAFNFISNNIIYVPLAANIDRLNQQYAELFQFISTNIIYVPIAGDFSYLINEYLRIVQIMQTTPIVIPIYGQFMGLIGGAGGGGGGGGGGMIGAAQGGVFEYFANGGMSDRDKATIKKLMGSGVQYNAGGNVAAGQLQKAMGLNPMSASEAQIIAPNTWRVVGDRAVGDEAFIPLVNTPRSHALLAEAADRMGYVLQKFAAGGFGNASSQTTGGAPTNGGYTSTTSTTNNEAPLIGGDLVLTVPQDTPVQDAMDEAVWQLRRLKRGGVHVRNKARGR